MTSRNKKKPLSLRAIVSAALYEVNLPITNRDKLAAHVAKRLGSHYVKTRAGWQKKVAPSLPRVVLGRGKLAKCEYWAGVTQPEARSIALVPGEPRNVISDQLQVLKVPRKYRNARVRLVAEILP